MHQGTPTLGTGHEPPITIDCYLMRGGRKGKRFPWTNPERPRGTNRFNREAQLAAAPPVGEERPRGVKRHLQVTPNKQKSHGAATGKFPEADAILHPDG